MIKRETFEVTRSVPSRQFEVSYEVTVGVGDEGYGFFEIYDIESGGEDYYAEGGLWFEDKTIADYDGVYSLPVPVIDKLKEWGYDVSEVE